MFKQYSIVTNVLQMAEKRHDVVGKVDRKQSNLIELLEVLCSSENKMLKRAGSVNSRLQITENNFRRIFNDEGFSMDHVGIPYVVSYYLLSL